METDKVDPIVESWNIHNRINLYLFDAISADALSVTSPAKGRTVGEQFAHIHNVRLMWLKSANPALLEGLTKLDKEALTAPSVRAALEASGQAVATLLTEPSADHHLPLLLRHTHQPLNRACSCRFS